MPNTPSFDQQASSYDDRVGLASEVRQAVARAVALEARLRRAELLLELGCGTGVIGAWLARESWRYVGLDVSAAMLEVFRRRLGPEASGRLLRADAGRPWPIEAGRVTAVFSSRALHLLDPDTVVSELERVAAPGRVTLLIGRVRRPRESLKRRLRERMREGLRRRGYAGRDGEAGARALVERLVECGWSRLEPQRVAVWNEPHSPRRSLEAWRGKPGLAGLALPDAAKAEVLDELESWAGRTFGGLDHEESCEESYTIEGGIRPGAEGPRPGNGGPCKTTS